MKPVSLAVLIAGAALLLSASAAHAGPIVRRHHRQDARITQGVQSGSLTPREAHSLHKQEGAIHRARTRALSDGHIGPVEARRITSAQSRAGRHIYRLEHNGWTASR